MSSLSNEIFILIAIFQLKHFIGDFPLQREYMLKKTISDWGFLLPLSTHCAVHGTLTLAIVLAYKPQLWWLSIADFFIHFIIDRLKSGPNYLGRYNDNEKSSYWNVLGFDQMVHHLTSLWIIWTMVQN
jgi:hypothetical protein